MKRKRLLALLITAGMLVGQTQGAFAAPAAQTAVTDEAAVAEDAAVKDEASLSGDTAVLTDEIPADAIPEDESPDDSMADESDMLIDDELYGEDIEESIPEYISDEDKQSYIEDGTWDERLAMMEELKDQQEELQSGLISNLALYGPAPIGQKQPVTGITGGTMPSRGNVKGILLTVEFEDEKFTSRFKNNIYKGFFGAENTASAAYPRESVSAYYKRSSYGKLNLSGEAFHYVSPKTRDSYNNKKKINSVLYREVFEAWKADILSRKPDGMSDSEYLTEYFSRFDSDGDGCMDAVYIIYAGDNTGWGSQWWSYRTNFNYTFQGTGVRTKSLVFMQSWKNNISSCVKTGIHETGHMLGLDDYYSYEKPKYNKMMAFDMMFNKAGDHDGFSKMMLGWLDRDQVRIITSNTRMTLESFSDTSKGGPKVAIITTKDELERFGIYSEFILAEYYTPTGNDRVPKSYNTRSGLRLYHIFAKLNAKQNAFRASNRYNSKIPLISAMDKDYIRHNKREKGDGYKNCFYQPGDVFSPWTLPGSSFNYDTTGTAEYLKAQPKYSGIYVKMQTKNLDNGTGIFDALFLDKNKYQKKTVLKPTGLYTSERNKYFNGKRYGRITFNQEVRVHSNALCTLYNGRTNKKITTIPASDILTTHPGKKWDYLRNAVYVTIPKDYIGNRYVRLFVPRSALYTPTGTFMKEGAWIGFNVPKRSGARSSVRNAAGGTGILNIKDLLEDEYESYSFESDLDEDGDGAMLLLVNNEEKGSGLSFYPVEEGYFFDPVKVSAPEFEKFDRDYASIQQVKKISGNEYLVVAENLYRPYDEAEAAEPDETAYCDLMLLDGDGAVKSERIIPASEVSCTGILGDKYGIAVPKEGSDAGQILTLYDPKDQAKDESYTIEAGLSNGDLFIGAEGYTALKQVGNDIAIAPDGDVWFILVKSGTDDKLYDGCKSFGETAGLDAIEYRNGKYYAAVFDAPSVSGNEVIEPYEVVDEVITDESVLAGDQEPEPEPSSADEYDEEYYSEGNGFYVRSYSSLDAAEPDREAYLTQNVSELRASDAGILAYETDGGGVLLSPDMSSMSEEGEICIHNAFTVSDNGTFLALCDENDTEEGGDVEETVEETVEEEGSEQPEDDEVDDSQLSFYLLEAPANEPMAELKPSITTLKPDTGTVGVAYSSAIEADGDMPMKWSVSAGQLPDGLLLDPDTGEISGTPEKAGEYKATLCAANDAGYDAKELTFTIVTKEDASYITVSGIPEYAEYTGKGITFPGIVVEYNGKTLRSGSDYSLKYRDNVNCGKAKIIVTLKGSLSGSSEEEFEIYPQDISGDDFDAEDITLKYKNGRALKPVPVLTWKGKKLKASKDYTVEGDEARSEKGEWTVTLKGSTNFEGERKVAFRITDQALMKEVKVKKIASRKYTGKDIRPGRDELTVTYKGKPVASEAFNLSYKNNVDPGKAYVVLTATGKKSGDTSFAGSLKVPFEIKGTALGTTLKKLKILECDYNGEAAEPVTRELLEQNGIELYEDNDFSLSYLKNDKAGTATAVFTGMGGYTGTVKKTFKINKADIKKAAVSVDAASYAKGGAKTYPVVTMSRVAYDEEGEPVTENFKLVYGTDYSLSFSSNKKAGTKGNVVIKGKGNYKGSISESFDIKTKALSENIIYVEDILYKEGLTGVSCKAKPVIMDSADSKKLQAGTDYDKDYSYFYAEDTADGAHKKDEALSDADKITAGTVLKVKITAKTGGNYTGEAAAEYRVVSKLINKAGFSVNDMTYTGEPVKPGPADIKTELRYGVDYEIVSNPGCVKGKGFVIVQGIGDYGNVRTVYYNVKSRSIK